MRVLCHLVVLELFQITVVIFANLQCDLGQTDAVKSMGLQRRLSRTKRYLTFPKSSTFVITLTGLKAIQVKEPTNWNLDLEFDMIWPIPSDTVKEVQKKKIKKKIMKFTRLRRHKRDLYSSIEVALNRLGLPGKDCMLKTICEAKTFLHPPGVSFIDDLLRVILSHAEHPAEKFDLYDAAYKSVDDCHVYKCPISFLQFLLNNDLMFQ